MKTGGIILMVIFIIVILIALYQYDKKSKIQNAAIASGIPKQIAGAIAESSSPVIAARAIGVPDTIAASIANGIPAIIS